MRLRIEIDLEGAAFEHAEAEVARLLRGVADADLGVVLNGRGQWSRVLFDANGNRCGEVTLLRAKR